MNSEHLSSTESAGFTQMFLFQSYDPANWLDFYIHYAIPTVCNIPTSLRLLKYRTSVYCRYPITIFKRIL
jgi:hypothetical protein